jgi:glycosyltransferase involved in cell wall biosynthesis
VRILIVDPKSSLPYDSELMAKVGLGGTEATLVRVAEGISCEHEVVVAQVGRKATALSHTCLRYVPLADTCPYGEAAPDMIVVLRKHRLVPVYRRRFPESALFLWVHNWPRPEAALQRIWLAHNACGVITVSDVHRAATERVINGPAARLAGLVAGAPTRVPVRRIYNPIAEDLTADQTPVRRDQLMFLSTANKGLRQVLHAFAEVRRRLPSVELLVAGTSPEDLKSNPQYRLGPPTPPGVHLLGRLPQHEVLRHVRESLCVFYPQNVHPETFGLVFAEANAVGTPVLAHDFGAAREVLSSAEQLVDATDHAAVVAKVEEWRNGGRPQATARPEFRASRVIGEWLRLIEERGAPA